MFLNEIANIFSNDLLTLRSNLTLRVKMKTISSDNLRKLVNIQCSAPMARLSALLFHKIVPQ